MKFLISPVLTLILLACDPGPPEVPANVSACEGACIVFDHFGCEVESENGNLKLCQDKCERIAMVGYVWAEDSSGPGCVVKVKTREQLRACNVRCREVIE